MDTFSNYLMNKMKLARKSKGISQEDLADLMGVTRVTINRWENGGGRNLTLAQFDRIAEYVGLNLDFILPNELEHENNDDEDELISNFRRLNNAGKREIIRVSVFYTKVPELSDHTDHSVSQS